MFAALREIDISDALVNRPLMECFMSLTEILFGF